jgi:hypothetical protein
MEFRQDRHRPWAVDPFCVDVLVLYPGLQPALWGRDGNFAETTEYSKLIPIPKFQNHGK